MPSAYWGEFRTHWRPLLAATLGLGVGIGLNAYTAGLFAPKLIEQFGWSRAQFALLGSFALLMLVAQPITGRLTDRFGVRTISLIGVVTGPIAYLALASQDGDIRVFFAFVIVQILFGTLTTSPVYTRLIAERFVRARGLAFSIAMTGPPLAGAVFAPILDAAIQDQGWRAGYLLLGTVSLILGLVAVALTPRHVRPDPVLAAPAMPEPMVAEPVAAEHAIAEAAAYTPADPRPVSLRDILRTPTFWVLLVGMVLVNMPQGLFSHQLKLVLLGSGATPQAATWLISIFAIGVMIGRFACGLSLDRLKPHLVAAFALGTPAVGLLMLASPFDAMVVLLLAVMVAGLAQGAEGDIAAYLVSRHFGLGVFSLVLGLLGAAIAGGAAIGSVLLSITLERWDSYIPFLLISAGCTLVGATMFLALGRQAQSQAPRTA